jgi:hypothetical protein
MGKREGRPLAVTLTIYGVFLFGAGCFLQSGQALFHGELFRSLPLSVPDWYLPLTGALWGAFWIILGAGMWRGNEWARRSALIAVPLQLGAWLADWFLLSRSTIAIQSFRFDLVLRLLAAGLVMAVLIGWGRREAPGKGVQDAGRESKPLHVE